MRVAPPVGVWGGGLFGVPSGDGVSWPPCQKNYVMLCYGARRAVTRPEVSDRLARTSNAPTVWPSRGIEGAGGDVPSEEGWGEISCRCDIRCQCDAPRVSRMLAESCRRGL